MILSAQTIRSYGEKIIKPFFDTQQVSDSGLTYGLSSCGYDIRIDQSRSLGSGDFMLASSMEEFDIPNDLLMWVVDKSSWARQGIVLQNTVAEPGWKGYLTLEITNHSYSRITLHKGDPIAQVIFGRLDQPTDQPYQGKYQNQPRGPQPAIRSK